MLALEEASGARLCRVRGSPTASSLASQAKKRSLALHMANQILSADLDAERDRNRRMRKERMKEEETSLLIDADRRGALPSLRSLREAVQAEDLEKIESKPAAGGVPPQGWQKRKLMDAFGDSIKCETFLPDCVC